MRYIILEDEKIAADRLKKLISNVRPEYQCILTMDSVESAVISLPALQVDLLFMDIQLADGLSFDIMDQVTLDTPIIFTTAYDEYAIKAFKANSIDYLLKPLNEEDLSRAITKFEKQAPRTQDEMDQLMKSLQPKGKERFVVKVGDHLKTVAVSDIQLIYSQDKATYLFTKERRRFPVDYTLDRVEDMLNPDRFFRISRKFIIEVNAIKDIIAFTNSRLEIVIDGYDEDQIIVARERVSDFKNWLDR